MNKLKLALLSSFLIVLSACTTTPVTAFKLHSHSLEQRDLQSRIYRDVSEEKILAASAALFQDMGYSIVGSETRLGLITGTKTVDATNGAEVVFLLASIILGGHSHAISDKREFLASIVILPRGDSGSFSVRMTMQHVTWDTRGDIRQIDFVHSPVIYTQFFDKLSKSIFLEKNI